MIRQHTMSSPGPKQHVFASLAEIAQALGHAHRLELLEHLGQGERNVEHLAERAGLTLANASRHLQLLRRAGLVVGRRDGKRVFYRLAEEAAVIGLLKALSRVGEQASAEIARVMASYFRARDDLEPVSREELLDRAICPVRSVCLWHNWQGASPNCRRNATWSPIAADPGASSRLRRSSCSGSRGTEYGGWRTGFRNGRRPACRSQVSEQRIQVARSEGRLAC